MRAFIILTFTILFHLGSSIIHSFPLNDANLETQWDNISIKDFQSSQNNKYNDAAKIARLNAKFVGVLGSFYDFQKLIRNTLTTSQLPTENIDLGTKNLWALYNEAPIPYMKYYMTLNCPLQSICKVKINSMQIQSDLTLSSPIQINGTTYSAYLSKPMDIILRGSPNGAINTTFTYNQSPKVQIHSQYEVENLQIDDNKLNSLVIQLKPKIVETLEGIFPFISKTEDIEIPNNSSEITSSFQRPNLYIIPDPKEINTTNNTHQVPQCIVDNLKKDIGEIINSNFIVVTEGLTNFSSAEMQGNFVIFGNMQVKTELNTENPLRGKFLWEFSSKQNSNNYSVKVDFTIDHLYVKTEMKDIGGFLNIKPKLEMNVDIGKLQFKTSVTDVIENEEKFSQCLRSIIAESVLNSSKEAINLEFGFTRPV